MSDVLPVCETKHKYCILSLLSALWSLQGYCNQLLLQLSEYNYNSPITLTTTDLY